MKFRVSREKNISWPNKCIWCGGKPKINYPVVGKGYLVPRYRLFDVNEYELEKVVVEYPVCRKHYFWSLGMDMGYLVVFCGMVLSLLMIPLIPLLFGVITIYFLLFSLLAPMLILSNLLKPVRLRWVRRNFYTMIIRNGDYAREFSMLNSLNPI